MYVVAIPTYNRHDVIARKTLHTLLTGGVTKSHIYLFVANNAQKELYETHVPKSMYKEIVVGKLGITNQRIFISRFFPEHQYVVSIDDDVEAIMHLEVGGGNRQKSSEGRFEVPSPSKLVPLRKVIVFPDCI